MNCDADKEKPVPMWLKEYDKYTLFSDGAHLMVIHTDLESIKSPRKVGYWSLVEMLDIWTNALSESFFWENRNQIENFVPVCRKHITAIVDELLRRKRKFKVHREAVTLTGKKYDARAIKLNIDQLEVMKHYFPDMQKRGKHYVAKCPWHDDHNPSLVIYPDGGCRCYVCPGQWDVFDVVQKFENLPFPEAVETAARLGGYYGICG